MLTPKPAGANPVVMVLPAYNEEVTVGHVVRRAPAEVRGHTVAVVVVDDGSTDGTAAAARAAGATVHSLDRNRGLGAAVRAGLARAVERRAAAVAFLDADGEYAPEELATLVAPILEGRLRDRLALRRSAAAHAPAPLVRQSPPHAGDEAAGATLGNPGPERRPVGLPGALTCRGRPRRDHPRLQLRPGAHAGPDGQGLSLRRGADHLSLPATRPIVRPAGSLLAEGGAGGLA